MGTRGEIFDVIHHLSPKVPINFLGNVEILLKCGARCSQNKQQSTEPIFKLIPTILGTNGDK